MVRNDSVSNLLYQDAMRRQHQQESKEIDSYKAFKNNNVSRSPSKAINDKILWRNLEHDLINSIQYNEIMEPMDMEKIEVILRDIGMLSIQNSTIKGNMMGRAKEKMLLTKMQAMLTSNTQPNVTFENLLIFLATVINIEVPYRDNVKQEYMALKHKLKILKYEEHSKQSSNDNNEVQMNMSQTGLLDLLPNRNNHNERKVIQRKSKYKYGYFNK